MRSTLPAPPPPSVGFLSGDPSAPAFLCQPLQGGLGWVPQISNALVGSWVYPDSPVHLCRVGQFLATLVWKCHLHLLQASALHMTGGPTSSATLLSSFPLSLSHFPHPDTAFSAPLSLLFCTPTLQCLPSLPFSEPLTLSTLSLGAEVPLSCPPVFHRPSSPTPAPESQFSAPALSPGFPVTSPVSHLSPLYSLFFFFFLT